ncbi:hypothetical protein B0T16DRAFT_456994 [Cercophora newfieldiana]|uniref:Uncharacterized protein n=1 Tax=Cercophora newfieldiana TaxID=92897 RepID=A0AA40CUL7_9PEZI|nr:hypothetical protein B0T16DRAFT_456994 [Cercophora newfieldiana]
MTTNLKTFLPPTAYELHTAFDMPVGNNQIVRAIAFSDRNGQFLNAGLSVVFTLIFAWLWGLVAAATIYMAPHRFSRRRLVALVALRNCSDPWSAFIAFSSFTMDSMGWCTQRRRPRRYYAATWQDSLFGFLLVLLSVGVVAGTIVMGIRGPPLIQVGRVAPVKADVLYYPSAEKVSASVWRAFRSGPSARALSTVDMSGPALRRDKVKFKGVKIDQEGQPGYELTYEYSIAGYEFGLKHPGGDLTFSTKGACKTEYGWLDKANSNETVDLYKVFDSDLRNASFRANLTGTALNYPPQASFMKWPIPDEAAKQRQDGNISFAVLTTLAHRGSSSAGQDDPDPWYVTEELVEPYRDSFNELISYRIKARRPALSCWEWTSWSCCGGHLVNGSMEFSKSGDFGVPEVLRDILGLAVLTPPVQRIGTNAGMSALSSVISSTKSIVGIIDAGSSSLLKDMERLVLAGYINTLNTLSDSALPDSTILGSTAEDMKKGKSNLFWDSNASALREGADDFFVASPDVQTFNLTGLIVVAVIVFVLLLSKLILTLKLTFWTNNTYGYPEDAIDPHQEISYSPFNKDRWARFKAFSAVHLLRNTYEAGTGIPEDDWMCSEDLPEPSEEKPLRLVRCGKGEYSCAGHIATDPELLGVRRTSVVSGKRSRTQNNSISTLDGFQEGFRSQEPSFRFPQSPPVASPPVTSPQVGNVGNPWNGQRYRDDPGQNSIPLLPVQRYSNGPGFEGHYFG